MRGLFVAIALLPTFVTAVVAQDPAERQRLQQQVMERFVQNYQMQAGLTEDQARVFHETLGKSFEAHARLQQRERQAWQALEGQMRPGVAANNDSVLVLLDALVQVSAERVEQMRADQAAYAEFLNPVQRAQLTLAWRRLQNQIQRIRQGRQMPMDRRPS